MRVYTMQAECVKVYNHLCHCERKLRSNLVILELRYDPHLENLSQSTRRSSPA